MSTWMRVAAGWTLWVALSLMAMGGDVPFRPALPGTTLQDFVKSPDRVAARLAPAVPPDLVDEGDSYALPNGKPVHLLRSRNSVAIRFAQGVASAKGLSELKARKEIPAHEVVARPSFGKKGGLHIVRSVAKGASLDPKMVQSGASVAYARHVLVDPKTKMRMIPTDEVLARFSDRTSPAAMSAAAGKAGLQIEDSRGGGKINVVRLRLLHPKTSDPLVAARVLAAEKGVVWSQPNFTREMRHFFTPSNPLFGDQQALHNGGQNFAVPGADVDAAHAWDRTTGNNSLVIAIIDDGVDISHPGLRIFTNPGESGNGKETNGVDDDGNGLVDDVHGWDFADNDNDPSPVGTNGHGTGTAGIAAAIFGSQAQTAGIAPGCTILPVKVADDTGTFTTDDVIGEAILYAAQYADVLSNSWGGGSQSAYIDDAINYAVTQGRQGKGCPVFFATGNYASTWFSGGGRYRLSTATLNGSYYYGFYYRKGLDSGGEDTVRIDNVCVLDADGYSHLTSVLYDEDFESFIEFDPFLLTRSGWWQYLTSDSTIPYWTMDTNNALTGTGGIFSAASPPLINKDDYSVLVTPPLAVTGVETVAFAGSVSIADDSDFYVLVFDGTTGVFLGAYGPWNGTPDYVDPSVGYPASNPQTIAVGAATDCDLRSDYSEYVGHLDFVAPSNGGWNDIATLDPEGDVGWTPEDYKMNFGGTSAATPLAAGIAALMLSQNPSLTAEEVRTLMHNTCDQIGGVTYGPDGTSPMYGYGRVNAAKAVASALPTLSIQDAEAFVKVTDSAVPMTFVINLDAPTIRDVTVDVSVTDGTALAGTNYLSAPATLTIPAGSTSVNYTVTIYGGVIPPSGAAFTVTMANPSNASLGASFATGTIYPLPTVGIQGATVSEGASGIATAMVFAVTLDVATIRDVTVNALVTDGTAVAGTNYLAGPTVITVPAGSTSASYTATVNGGTLARPTGTFTVTLSNPTNAELGASQATGTIRALDSDGDGMPDYWEVLHGLNPFDSSDASLDADSDGFTNLQEFQMGTDPRDPGSRFSISSVQPSASGESMVIGFNTVADRTYRVEFKNDLNDPAWQVLGTDILGTGGAVQVVDTVSTATTPTRFYHVVVWPP